MVVGFVAVLFTAAAAATVLRCICVMHDHHSSSLVGRKKPAYYVEVTVRRLPSAICICPDALLFSRREGEGKLKCLLVHTAWCYAVGLCNIDGYK